VVDNQRRCIGIVAQADVALMPSRNRLLKSLRKFQNLTIRHGETGKPHDVGGRRPTVGVK